MIQIFEYHSLEERGWRMWTQPDENGLVLMLCPLVDFDNVPEGTTMVSISGGKYVKGQDDIDDDTRAGLLAYGVVVKKSGGEDE